MRKNDLVYVTWIDSTYYSGWTYGSELEGCKLPILITVGFFIKKENSGTYLAMSAFSEDDNYGNVMIIPTACITSITALEVKKKERIKS